MLLRTERLVIRHLTREDTDALQTLLGDAETVRYWEDGTPLTRAQVEALIDEALGSYAERGYGPFAVDLAETGRLIGLCGLEDSLDSPGDIEVLYVISKAYWGRGYAGEAAAAVVRLAFERFHLPRIIATIDPANVASLRIVEKLGFVFWKRAPDVFGLTTDYFVLESGDSVRSDSNGEVDP